MTRLLIHNGNVLQIDKNQPQASILREHDVLIKDKRIEAVQPSGQVDHSHFDEVIDATGKTVMPGLINTHAHIPMIIFRGLAEDVSIDRWFNEYIWPLEKNLQPEDVYWGMKLGHAEMIRGGVTTSADHYFHLDDGAKAIDEMGTRAVLAWAFFGDGGLPALERGAQFSKEWQGAAEGRITTMLGPHATYTCDDKLLSATAETANELGVKIHIHAAETRDQTQASLQKRGITPIQVLEKTGILQNGALIAHACGATERDITLMAKYNATVAYAIKTHLKLSMGHTPVRALRDANIAIGLATDGACSSNTYDIWEAMRLLAMIQKEQHKPEFMPIPEALWIATRDSARTLGLEDEIGAIEAGYLADMIIVNMSGLHHQPLHSITASLVFNTMASDVETTIVNGKVLMRERELLTVDTGEVIEKVNQSMQRLAQRQPDQRIQTYNP